MNPSAKAGAEEAPASAAVLGTAYLLCFGPDGLHVTGNRYARHYIGWTQGLVDGRLVTYLGETAPLVRAAVEAGLKVEIADTWPIVGREFAEALRRRKDAPRVCSQCRARETAAA